MGWGRASKELGPGSTVLSAGTDVPQYRQCTPDHHARGDPSEEVTCHEDVKRRESGNYREHIHRPQNYIPGRPH